MRPEFGAKVRPARKKGSFQEECGLFPDQEYIDSLIPGVFASEKQGSGN